MRSVLPPPTFGSADASETTVKRAPLADYGIVYFAAHGLVAGEVKGVAGRSLALSIPQQPSDSDDDLLTSSELAQLKLNADRVVLSACGSGDRLTIATFDRLKTRSRNRPRRGTAPDDALLFQRRHVAETPIPSSGVRLP